MHHNNTHGIFVLMETFQAVWIVYSGVISQELYHLDEKILKGCIKILLHYGITINAFLMLLTAVVGFYD